MPAVTIRLTGELRPGRGDGPGNRAGQHSIRINAERRICFRWASDGPHDVEIVDDRSVGEGRRP